jgi:hypothetical protein
LSSPLSAISSPLSAISFQLSAISFQLYKGSPAIGVWNPLSVAFPFLPALHCTTRCGLMLIAESCHANCQSLNATLIPCKT